MKYFIKQLISLVLPLTVLVIVPESIEKDLTIKGVLWLVPGTLFTGIGFALLVSTIFTFYRFGKGTLAPWFPTQKLVITGPYRYVRNPMILGVLFVLIGESLLFYSQNIAIWTILFFLINNLYFTLFEEPSLKRRFGQSYLEYQENVPRWLPRIKPYHQNEKS